MKRILVTGGAGYVGSGLMRDLLASGYEVACVDKLMFGGESLLSIWHDPAFTFERCDICEHDAIDAILKRFKPDAVIHLAAIVGDPACRQEPELARETNWNASVHLLEKCVANGVTRFLFASTCSNYGKMKDPNGYVAEDSLLAPVSLYAELKVRFEKLMLEELGKIDGFYPTSLRFSTVYGLSPRMRFDLTVNEFTKDLAMGHELVVFGEQFWRPYCHVKDFSRAFITVLEAPEILVGYNVYNVGATEENYTKQMIVNAVKEEIPEAKINYIQKDEDPRDYRVNFEKIKKELGFVNSLRVLDGIREIRDVVSLGVIADPEDQRYYNITHKRASFESG